MERSNSVLTIGHSNGDFDRWTELLKRSRVEVLVDIRSAPYSRYAPQFNGPVLARRLPEFGVSYLDEGEALGGRPRDSAMFDREGHVLYGRVAASEPFRAGIVRIMRLARSKRVALLCSEEDPSACHRHLLVGRVLVEAGWQVLHLRHDGREQRYEEMADVRDAQPALFALSTEEEDLKWRSLRSVSPRETPRSSSQL